MCDVWCAMRSVKHSKCGKRVLSVTKVRCSYNAASKVRDGAATGILETPALKRMFPWFDGGTTWSIKTSQQQTLMLITDFIVSVKKFCNCHKLYCHCFGCVLTIMFATNRWNLNGILPIMFATLLYSLILHTSFRFSISCIADNIYNNICHKPLLSLHRKTATDLRLPFMFYSPFVIMHSVMNPSNLRSESCIVARLRTL